MDWLNLLDIFRRRGKDDTEISSITKLPPWLKVGCYAEYSVNDKKHKYPTTLVFEILKAFDRKGKVKVKIGGKALGSQYTYTIDPDTLLASHAIIPFWIRTSEIKKGDEVLMAKPIDKPGSHGTVLGSEAIDTSRYGLRECWKIKLIRRNSKGTYWYDKETGLLISNILEESSDRDKDKILKIYGIISETNIL